MRIPLGPCTTWAMGAFECYSVRRRSDEWWLRFFLLFYTDTYLVSAYVMYELQHRRWLGNFTPAVPNIQNTNFVHVPWKIIGKNTVQKNILHRMRASLCINY